MKILLVHNRYVHEGGEEESVASLAELMSGKGHDIRVWGRSSAEWVNHSMSKTALDAFRTIYSFESAASLKVVLTDFKPDVIHIHNIFPVLSPSVLLTARQSGAAVIQTLHNYRWLCANGLFLTPAGQACERCKGGNFLPAIRFGCYQDSRLRSIPMAISLMVHRDRQTLRNSVDRFIAPSPFLRSKYLEAGFDPDRIEVIPNPIRIPSLPRVSRAREPQFVYAGRLSREKGILTLLNAFKDNVPGRLVILGDGPLLSTCQQEQSSRIEVLGKIPHEAVFEKLASAWALVMPSECYENLPQAVLEAWFSGTPVLASRLGGLADLVQEGETGWLFEPGQAVDLTRKLRDIAAHPNEMKALSDKCRTRVQTFYNTDEIYSKLISVYDKAHNDRIIHTH